MHLSLDFNIELYPLRKGDVFTLALASSLSRQVVEVEDGDDVRDVWRPDDKGRIGIETDYQYVMYGKVSLHFDVDFLFVHQSSLIFATPIL